MFAPLTTHHLFHRYPLALHLLQLLALQGNSRKTEANFVLYRIKNHQSWCYDLNEHNLKKRGNKYDSLFAEGGADLLLVETVFDTLNCKAALFAISDYFDESGKELPIMVSGTITDASGRTLSGQTAEAFLISISHLPLLTVGFNCALGAEELRPYLETVANKTEFFVSAHPNAGLPNAFGEYDQTAEQMGGFIEDFISSGFVNIIGGCCGTTPEHIAAIAEAVEDKEPRETSEPPVQTRLSGLEPFTMVA